MLVNLIYTRAIHTLKAKKTHLRTTGVVQACHNFLISMTNKEVEFPALFASNRRS